MHVSRNSSASMMFRASTNIPSHLLRASYSMCYKPPYFPNINGRNQAGASLRLDNRNSHPNASPKRMFRLSRLAVVSAHAAANTPRFVPLVIPHYLRVVRPVVVIIIGPLVSRRIGTGGDEVSVVRRPGQSVVHLVVVARLGVSGKVHGSSAHGKRGQRSSRISGGWGDRRNFLAEVSELLVGPDAKRDGGLLKKTRHGPRGRHRLSAVA
mmetsp:Transcript_70503/g.103344  ORF Transcript_70503/g.103344 Transcript_70503/m.103344 type:complete len:210 (-) Transcript_70503:152-781(-)